MEKAPSNSWPAASQENKNPVIKDIDAKMSYGHKQLGSLSDVPGRRSRLVGRDRESRFSRAGVRERGGWVKEATF